MKCYGHIDPEIIGKKVYMIDEGGGTGPALIKATVTGLKLDQPDADATKLEILRDGCQATMYVSMSDVFESTYEAIKQYEDLLESKTRDFIASLREQAKTMKEEAASAL